ncbi:hypothetical protein NQ315_003648 [Exocentrus adspersus]|uniref:Piezo TM1-24 domain-containing protein n=1 Tax=Exocentrus adspersus TaxID=1586481 RepID=A0AAV8VCA7_9CUCU|nr:hypothetical protein NQ315_003648 [Exocentrus adspersus]
MIMLVMVYTYQFENFEIYWENLGVPREQQDDIGLVKYETKQLFVRLVTPTFFVIITVIQLHYFHKDFMDLSDPKNVSILNENGLNEEDLDQSSLQGGAVIEHNEKDETTTSSIKFDLYELGIQVPKENPPPLERDRSQIVTSEEQNVAVTQSIP